MSSKRNLDGARIHGERSTFLFPSFFLLMPTKRPTRRCGRKWLMGSFPNETAHQTSLRLKQKRKKFRRLFGSPPSNGQAVQIFTATDDDGQDGHIVTIHVPKTLALTTPLFSMMILRILDSRLVRIWHLWFSSSFQIHYEKC